MKAFTYFSIIVSPACILRTEVVELVVLISNIDARIIVRHVLLTNTARDTSAQKFLVIFPTDKNLHQCQAEKKRCKYH